jgi:hypothetical protein
MQLTLTDTGRTGRVSRNGTPVTYRSFEVSERVIVELYGYAVRPHSVTLYSNGDVEVFFMQVTKRGTDFKSGIGYPESLEGMRKAGKFPEVREAVAEAVTRIAVCGGANQQTPGS